MTVVCRFLDLVLGVRRTFDAENVVGITSGLKERLLRYNSLLVVLLCSAIRFIAALDVAYGQNQSVILQKVDMHVQITQKQIKSYYTEAEKNFAITTVSLLPAVLTQTTVNTEHAIQFLGYTSTLILQYVLRD